MSTITKLLQIVMSRDYYPRSEIRRFDIYDGWACYSNSTKPNITDYHWINFYAEQAFKCEIEVEQHFWTANHIFRSLNEVPILAAMLMYSFQHGSLLRIRSLGSGKECLTSPKNVCVGGYQHDELIQRFLDLWIIRSPIFSSLASLWPQNFAKLFNLTYSAIPIIHSILKKAKMISSVTASHLAYIDHAGFHRHWSKGDLFRSDKNMSSYVSRNPFQTC